MALSFRLPAIRSVEGAELAVEKVTQALHPGQCTPPEATEVMKIPAGALLRDVQMSRLDKLGQMRGPRYGANVKSERSPLPTEVWPLSRFVEYAGNPRNSNTTATPPWIALVPPSCPTQLREM
ncbi:MAG TPA: hypothetical protein VIY49_39620 [Bryobacteraceae bacterium]